MANAVCLYRSKIPSSSEFYELYLKQLGVDFTFICANNVSVKAHKIVLMATSSYFYEQFKGNENFKEPSNSLLPHLSANVVRLFLELIYTNKAYGPSKEINETMKLADVLGVKYLGTDDRTDSNDDPTICVGTEEPQLNPDPIEIVDEHQDPPEGNYSKLLKNMTLQELSSSCLLCQKFYPDIKKHIKKCRGYRRKYTWQCAQCNNKFYWLKKESHVCQD